MPRARDAASMLPEGWVMSAIKPDEEAIFHAARCIDAPEARRAYVEQACGHDRAFTARMEALLGVYDQERTFLDSPFVEAQASNSSVPEGPGAVIGPYKLLEQIGEGGFGVVFMAEQQHPVRRRVALKVIKPGMDTRQVVARFEAERQALALMDHPHIAHVLDGGQTSSGRPYFVMELVRGIPVTEFCDQNRLSIRQRLGLFVSVCQALQHAHHKAIIHRDIKPSNVLVTLHDGEPVIKVIDFGVAKAIGHQLTERTLLTAFVQMVGTPLYMSPEQAEMSGLDIDTRSDIYSLGVLLYELLTGTTPLIGERLKAAAFDEIRRIIREEEPAKPSTRVSTIGAAAATVSTNRQSEPQRLRRSLRGELDWIVMKCLEKDRTRRYETASSLAADLQRYLHDEPVLACPPSTAYRVRKFVRRNKGPVLAALALALALALGIVGTTWGLIRATDARAVAVNEANKKEAALRAARQSERDAKDKLWLSLYERARAGRYGRQMGQRLDSLAALADAARIRPAPALRDEAIAAMALPDVRRTGGWRTSSPGVGAAAYGRQHRFWARADSQGFISIRSIPDDQEIQRIVWGPILGTYLHFSPDERFLLALGEGYKLGVWRVADGQPAIRDKLQGCRSHAFSPDGKRLTVGQGEWLLLFDLVTGEEVKRWRLPAPAHTLAFHPDSSKLAVGFFSSSAASVYDASSGALLTDLPVTGMSNQVVAWHPDGERLAVAGSDPRIQIWNVAARRKVATLEGHIQHVAVLTFHPDGELLASHGWDGQLLLWHPSSGRQLMRLTSVTPPQFSADGRLLGVAWHCDSADRLEVTTAREYRTLVSSAGAGRGGYGNSAISPDGRLLAVGTDEGAHLWDLNSGRALAVLPAGTHFVFFEASQSTPSGGTDSTIRSNGPPWSLLTSGPDGLLRWSITSNGSDGRRLKVGPPQQLSPLRQASFALTADGRTLAAVTEDGTSKILDLETATVRLEIGSDPLGAALALSGDGRWVASSGWYSDRVQLWNASRGQMVHEWVVGKRTFVFFTPDSRALIIARGDEFSFWDVETFEPIRRLPRDVAQFPGCVAFSPDGRLMALEMEPAIIHLKDVATGQTVAKLEDPHGDRATFQCFTPDGTQLVVVAKYARAIHIWDLRAIRKRLKEMNLDWDWPPVCQEQTTRIGGGCQI